NRIRSQFGGMPGIAAEEVGLLSRPAQVVDFISAKVLDQALGFIYYPGFYLPILWRLLSPPIDQNLTLRTDSLVGGEGVDREKPRRVPRQAIGGHHANPPVHCIQFSRPLPLQEVTAQ